jgi:hypothetical protein
MTLNSAISLGLIVEVHDVRRVRVRDDIEPEGVSGTGVEGYSALQILTIKACGSERPALWIPLCPATVRLCAGR